MHLKTEIRNKHFCLGDQIYLMFIKDLLPTKVDFDKFNKIMQLYI